ncbi:MAG TPA: hypothetical protein VGK20_08920 [Candidatus Binatia bacterium]
MIAAALVTACEAAGIVLSVTTDGGLHLQPTPDAGTVDRLREHKAEILALLRTKTREAGAGMCRLDPDFPEVVPDPEAEAAALADGWTRRRDGRWEFPAGWSSLYPRTPEGDDIDWPGIDALRAANEVPLPDDRQPGPGLRPLTEEEKRQIRTAGAPLPPGVSYGRTPTGQWRRLT